MKIFVIQNTYMSELKAAGIDLHHGWGNGYVAIPPGHPLHGVGYDDIDVDVHGGLTYSNTSNFFTSLGIKDAPEDHWIVGFDTMHAGDTMKKWPESRVREETERLKEQLINYKS